MNNQGGLSTKRPREFAFLLLDRRKRRLLAVRDRLGVKPLYYHSAGSRTVFASEAKAIFATGFLSPRIDAIAVHDKLCEMWPASYFLGVTSLDPGCLMEIDVDSGNRRIHRYWDLDLPAGDVKTNTRRTKTYDHILIDRRMTREYTGRFGVLDFQNDLGLTEEQAILVSDHQPLWAEFSAYELPTFNPVAAGEQTIR